MAKTKTADIIRELIVAYWMEMETILNYIANAVNLEGLRAEEVKKALTADISAELGHAQSLANRIHELEGIVPGSMLFQPRQKELQPPADSTDVVDVIKGVITAEDSAIAQYNKIIRLSDGADYVTQELCIQLLASEETHRREFRGFLTEYEKYEKR